MRVPLPSLLGAVGLLLVVGLTALSYVQSSAILSGVESLRESRAGLPQILNVRSMGSKIVRTKTLKNGETYSETFCRDAENETREEFLDRVKREWAQSCAIFDE